MPMRTTRALLRRISFKSKRRSNRRTPSSIPTLLSKKYIRNSRKMAHLL